MIYSETQKPQMALFDFSDKPRGTKIHFAQLISSDGLTLTTTFDRIFNINNILTVEENKFSPTEPNCLYTNFTYNFIVKKFFFDIASYSLVAKSFDLLKKELAKDHVEKIALSKENLITVSKLPWTDIKDMLTLIFMDTDYELVICDCEYIKEESA